MIKDVKISNMKDVYIPEKGFYINLKWMYGDADGENVTREGPFPEEYKYLFIEFLNVVNAMINEYSDSGKGGFDKYDHVPGVSKFFDELYARENNFDWDNMTPEQEFINNLQIGIERIPDGSCDQAQLIDYTVYYHDGENINKYSVEIIKE